MLECPYMEMGSLCLPQMALRQAEMVVVMLLVKLHRILHGICCQSNKP